MLTNVPRAVRALRRERGWSQTALGKRAGVSREAVSRIERGAFSGMTLGSIDRIAAGLGATLGLHVRWQGARLDQLIDAAHAAIQQQVAQSLTDFGWVVQAEVSFNHYGDRGRVDIVALHPRTRLVLIVEVKSALGDLQEAIGRLDVKVRLGRRVAAEVGWTAVDGVVGALVIGDSRAARRVVPTHEALFRRFSLRGRWALAWIRRPSGGVPSGLLWFVDRTDSRRATRRR